MWLEIQVLEEVNYWSELKGRTTRLSPVCKRGNEQYEALPESLM